MEKPTLHSGVPSTGEWFILRSENSSYYSVPFGTNGDVPAPGDYDGDGKFDTTVFRPSTATWYSNRSTAGVSDPTVRLERRPSGTECVCSIAGFLAMDPRG
jgi:hypothetical protein